MESIHYNRHRRLDLLAQLEGLALWNLDRHLHISGICPHQKVRIFLHQEEFRPRNPSLEDGNLVRRPDMESVHEGSPPRLAVGVPSHRLSPSPCSAHGRGHRQRAEHLLLLHSVDFYIDHHLFLARPAAVHPWMYQAPQCCGRRESGQCRHRIGARNPCSLHTCRSFNKLHHQSHRHRYGQCPTAFRLLGTRLSGPFPGECRSRGAHGFGFLVHDLPISDGETRSTNHSKHLKLQHPFTNYIGFFWNSHDRRFFDPFFQLVITMHSLNAILLLVDAALNCLRFPFFRIAYFFSWTVFFVVFQWILHACVPIRWPYPFLDMSSPYSPIWYLSAALLHIPCYGAFALVVKLKQCLLVR
ncbi:hypothetical protein SAY86_009198 [Trapa natans]|uniref:Uncharacterized protein n=1 Tax=Trapa natans TaxID=22666 RepID=A0AAN7L197_TRANT|nr:hypothetical protein SAY86_009198 [Trapa natans]